MVGRDHLKIITPKPLPKLFLVGFVAQRRRHDVLSAFEAFLLVTGVIEKQILRASLGIYRQTQIPRRLDLFKSVVATEVNDVDGRVRHLGNRNCPVDTLGLGSRRAC